MAELRTARGFTQEQLAERAEVSARYVQRIEAGGENLTLETIATIAAALKVQPYQLLEPHHAPPAKVGRPRARSSARRGGS